MSINLTKGQKVDLTKSNPGIKNLLVGLGWDTNKYSGGHNFDLDASVFLVNANGKCRNEKDFVYFNNLEHPTGSVILSGDNLTGEGDGDDEDLKVVLDKIPADVEKLIFAVSIYDAEDRGQNFGQVSNAYIRVVNDDTSQEVIRYDLSEDYSLETAIVVGEMYRHNGEWKFAAIGSGFEGGFGTLCKTYGL